MKAAATLPPALSVQGLGKAYGERAVFHDLSFTLESGEVMAILGPSGSGKSTLLNCVAGLDSWDAGRVLLAGNDLGELSDDGRALLRRRTLGFVFQAFHILPHLNVAQNVALPLLLLGHGPDPARPGWTGDSRVLAMLGALGLDGLEARMPSQLSGGQLQRVAIARALIHRPPLLLADEPTGNLDTRTATRTMDLLLEQAGRHGSAVLLVTHAESLAERATRVLRMD